MFDTVIVITDRLVLDQQLQDTIYQFEHKKGVVEKIDEDTQQLAKALATRVPIIISTIQKFPFIAGASTRSARRARAVAIDTAGRALRRHRRRGAFLVGRRDGAGPARHPQQGRHRSRHRRRKLLDDEDDSGLTAEAREAMLRDMAKRPRQPNLSYFAFTATPKFKTKALFDEPGDDGQLAVPPLQHAAGDPGRLHPRRAGELHDLQGLLRPREAGRRRSRSAEARSGHARWRGSSPSIRTTCARRSR